jgi:AAA domain
MTPDEFLRLPLKKVTGTGDRRDACCPSHDDRDPSLSIKFTHDRILVKCQAKGSRCTEQTICTALGIKVRDLFYNPRLSNGLGDQVGEFTYVDENGTRLFQSVKFRTADGGKTFRQRHLGSAGEWVWNMNDTRRVVYHLDEVRAVAERRGRVLVLEGEKDVDNLRKLGLTGTTNPMGAGKWASDYTMQLAGVGEAVVIVDADDAGREHGRHVATSLTAAGIRTKYVDLWPDRHDGSDFTDWLEANMNGDPKLALAKLRDIVETVPVFGLQTGRKHARSVAASLQGVAASVSVVEPVEGKDASDQLEAGCSLNELVPVPPELVQASGSEPARRYPFRPIGEALRNTPDEPPWKVEGMIAPGLVTVLAGRPKVGKSTLMFGALKALAIGEPFLGAEVTSAKALLLSEERELTLKEKWSAFALDDDDVHVLMRYEADGDWTEVVEEAVRYCAENEIEILIVDAFDKWPGLRADDENSTGAMLKALEPLFAAAGAGLAVVIVAHQRKGKGQHGEALRGSNAFAGAADVILELERATGEFGEQGGRVLYGTSRLMSTPEKLAISWDQTTGVYTAGDLDEIELMADKDRVAAALDDEERERNELADRLEGMRAERLGALLKVLLEEGVAFRSGKGKKGSAYRWRRRRADDPDDESVTAGLEQNAVPATDSVPEAGNGISGSTMRVQAIPNSIPAPREQKREWNPESPITAEPVVTGPPAGEWLARDGEWRSLASDPPGFEGEVVEVRGVVAVASNKDGRP